MGASDQGQLGDGIPLNFVNRPELIVGVSANITTANAGGENLVFSGIGLAGSTNYVLMSTNFTLPRNLWTRVKTNILGANGNFTVTNPMPPNVPGNFYLLQSP